MNLKFPDSWTVFTKFTMLNEKTPEGNMWSGKRLAIMQATTRPDLSRPEKRFGVSKAAERKEKQQWAIDKTKLGIARKLRSICFIELDDEFQETS